jgi:hypothetical protein
MSGSDEVQRVSGLVPGADDEKMTSVVGDLEEARTIAGRSLDVVARFSQAVICGDVEQAYALCANELRISMSVKRFVTELQKQDDEWGGKPIEYNPQAIHWIYASDASRKRSNKDHEWPKETPKPNKRALLTGWWTTEKPPSGENFGRPVQFWVAEEAEGYRISKFRPTRP